MKTLILIALAMVACAASQPKPQQSEPCAALRWDEAKYGECPKDGAP